MKKLLLIITLLLPLVANAFKIETDEIDEFTGKRTVITSWEGMCRNEIHIRFRQQSGNKLFDFKFMNGSVIVIGANDELMIKSTNDSIVKFTPTGIFSGGRGDGAVGINGSGVWGINAHYKGNLEWFLYNTPRLLRFYTTRNYIEREISPKDAIKFKELANLFFTTLKGEVYTPTQHKQQESFSLQYLKKKKSNKKWEVVKEEYLTDVKPEDVAKIKADWKSKTDDTYDYDVKIKRDR